MARLQDKVAIVTGGARGMGSATSRIFAAEGAKVIIADVLDEDGENLAQELKDSAIFYHHIADTEKEEFERVLGVNLVGFFLGIKTVGPRMIARNKGSIINVSSVDGMKGANGLAAYCSSKWGIRGLTRVAAMELGHHGVRVNSVHPGGVNTIMSNPMFAPREEIDKNYTHVPLQRIGEPEEVARATLFLASDDASYLCGAEIAVDGGMLVGHYYQGLPGAPGV